MDFLTKEFIYQKSSQEITALLYEVLIETANDSIQDIHNSLFIDANIKMKKMNEILHRLGVGLNYEAGIIADQLDALYNYMADLVIKANMSKDPTNLKEVVDITKELSTAWRHTMRNKTQQPNKQRYKQTNAYEKNIMMDHHIETVEMGK
ncbi:flagellar export chaperone FliS [Rossellomorea sp. FS2]|uniref:flagellar export chaperone FliS n=1 Tax=Rossellomorea sp. FS2 TaxID=3391447 RepID=UPI003A4D1E9A